MEWVFPFENNFKQLELSSKMDLFYYFFITLERENLSYNQRNMVTVKTINMSGLCIIQFPLGVILAF